MTDFKSIKPELKESGELLWLNFNRPKANILDAAMMSELSYALNAHKDDKNLKMVVLQGSGGHFSFGASIEEHKSENVATMLKSFHALARQIASFPVPVASLIEGQCLGGAFEIALCTHFAFATPNAIMACPEIKLGVFPPVLAAIGAQKLGCSWAEKLLLSGCNMIAGEGVASGFISKIFTDSEPDKSLLAWFKENLQPLSAFSLRQATKAMRKGSQICEQLDSTLNELEVQYLEELTAGHDGKEGILSFIEKRKLVWSNC